MKNIYLWQGFHSQDFQQRFNYSWQNNDLLICCPPPLTDFSFIPLLPKGNIEFCGPWSQSIDEVFDRRLDSVSHYPDKPVLGVFTTGTNRQTPKLILYSKKNILTCAEAIFKLYDQERIDTVFSFPQPYHVFGLLLGYALSLHFNLKLIVPYGKYSTSHLNTWLDLNNEKLLTLMTPTHLRDLVEIAEKRGFKPRPTYSCILGGARVLRSDWLDAKNQLQISAPSIGYGCSEASPGISHLGPGIEPLEDGEIGDYLNHLQVTSLPTGLDVAGASICLATIENAKIDFPKNLKVNDLIVKSPSGRNVFTARTDIILNRGGEKFSLESIENFLKLKHGLDTICVALKDDRLGEELGIVISGKTKTTPLSRDEIYASLTLNFGRRFSAKNVQEVEELPMNANSKIDRKKAVTLFRAN